jgi:hypothetical protein
MGVLGFGCIIWLVRLFTKLIQCATLGLEFKAQACCFVGLEWQSLVHWREMHKVVYQINSTCHIR